jgi:hypothetical protein
LVTNPKLVETGLDMIWFSSECWYEIDYSLYTVIQASRRVWRPGQEQDVTVHFVAYQNTMEHKATELVGRKLAASLLLTGDTVEGALVQQNDDGRGFLSELAKSALAGAAVDDLQSIFKKINAVSSERLKATSQYIGGHFTSPDCPVVDVSPIAAPIIGLPALGNQGNLFDAPTSPVPTVADLPVAAVEQGMADAQDGAPPPPPPVRVVLKQMSFF